MFYVSAIKHMTAQVEDALRHHFKDAVITPDAHTDGYLAVDIKSGHPGMERKLSVKEQKMGVCGGGVIVGLDGKKFVVKVEEVK